MKIAFCIENLVPARGGAEQYVKDLSRRVCEQGHEIQIFTLKSDIDDRDNLRIHLLKAPRRPKFLRTLSFAIKCRRRVGKEKFDIIHSFGRTWGMDVFQPLGGSQMASLRGNIRSIDNPLIKFLRILSYIFSLRRIAYFLVESVQMKEARMVISISAMVKRDLKKFTTLEDDRIKIVRNGVSLEKFHPRNRDKDRDRIRREMGLKADDILIIFVAHNFRLKGLRPLIKTMARLRSLHPDISYKLGILGEGKKKKFSRYADRCGVGDSVIFIGSTDHAPGYYAAADISVHPSFYDPSALVVLEAMATGLPVITTTYCGTSEIIEDGREGFVVADPNDIEGLSARIFDLVDPDLRRAIGMRGRERAEEFPYSRNMQEILDAYGELA